MKIPISVLILTKNEENNLPECLASVCWSDDIVVLDSYSSDRTVDIVREAGARVYQRKFDCFSAHQNWALENIAFKHSWVFYIDADERATPQLSANMCAAIETEGHHVAFRIQRRDFFMSTWLKHVQASPFYLRLFRPEHMRYERAGHPVSVPDGSVGQVEGYLDHYPFSKGLAQWFDRHNLYSTQEAEQTLQNHANAVRFSIKKAFFGKDFHERRYHQKEIFYRLPGRPLIKFFGLYFLKRGFLDGQAGLTYALLISMYEYMIIVKTRELAALKNTAKYPTALRSVEKAT
jgi:glycosyltransferase involved in cell wall biosynthesis